MRIGFDVDGCLANFNPGYIQKHIEVTGKNLFLPGDEVNPPVWDFAGFRGYTKEETSEVWKSIKESSSFWRNLPTYAENCAALARFYFLRPEHDLYFITSRVGSGAKEQTEQWFQKLGFLSTVLIVGIGQKGNIAKALQLDAYIDDYYPNCEDVVRTSPQTRCYVLDRHYNRRDGINQLQTLEDHRVSLLEQFLQRECLIT